MFYTQPQTNYTQRLHEVEHCKYLNWENNKYKIKECIFKKKKEIKQGEETLQFVM